MGFQPGSPARVKKISWLAQDGPVGIRQEEEPGTRDRRAGESPNIAGDALAAQYLEQVCATTVGSAGAWARAACQGAELAQQAGSIEGAAEALARARTAMGRRNLQGVHDGDLDGKVEATLLEYLREVEQEGARARSTATQEVLLSRPLVSLLKAPL